MGIAYKAEEDNETQTQTQAQEDEFLIERLINATAKLIDQHKTTLFIEGISNQLDVPTCPLCGVLVGDSTLHARIHLGPPDMQLALMNAID